VTRRKAWALQQMRFWGGKIDYDKYEDQEEPVKPAKKKKHK
jgi:hypothetical protein